MGYANTSQLGSGLRQRLYSRAFIVGEPNVAVNRWIYLVLDTQSGDTAVRDGILRGLRDMGREYAVYGASNVAVTGTHSHSGPGAWLNYLLPQITSRGFSKESYEAIVRGTLLSIRRAHESLEVGTISAGKTRVEDANINRSLYAYLANPEEERKRYADDVDKDLTLLRFTRLSDGKDIGVLTWFAVHGTSMLGNNTLITGDNKGVAAYLFEKHMQGTDAAPGFVAGFSQANVGDTSPNVLGAYCEDGSGEMCQLKDSTCGGRSQDCHGRGPFFALDDAGTRSCFEIGRRQFEGARRLYSDLSSAIQPKNNLVTGSTVRSLHTFVSLANYTFPHPNGTIVRTCPAAMGYSFAAGTSDGPGAFDFKQNSSRTGNASPVWAVVRDLLHAPDDEQKACQYPKPILLDVGETKKPYDWSPNIVDIQLLRAGNLIVIVSPGEATTMAGRRWREAIHDAAKTTDLFSDGRSTRKEHSAEPLVVLGGPANSYTHYITTEEEYTVQRYEGASTLYGPHTLNAYINLTLTNLPYLSASAKGSPEKGPQPPINTNRSLSFITGVVVDRAGFFKDFGDVVDDVEDGYRPGEVASVRFVGANPRNNLRPEGTYALVERFVESTSSPFSTPAGVDGDELKPRLEPSTANGMWVPFLNDEDWELVFNWKRTSTIAGTSEVTIQWEVPTSEDIRGRYRIRYFGDSKSIGGSITPFEGVSKAFEVR
jgi:neutral ceramidase